MASAAKSFECIVVSESTSNCTSANSVPEVEQRTDEQQGLNISSKSQNCNSDVDGSDRNDRTLNWKKCRRPTSAKTPQANSRVENKRASNQLPGAANNTQKEQQVNHSQETPQKRPNYRGPASHEINTPEVNMMRSYLIRLPRAMPRQLRWVMGDDLWNTIHAKQNRSRGPESVSRILHKHPAIKPQMRAILFDWIIEVCEVYNQLRDTYYLAMDLFDRYLFTTENLPKDQLQLVGVTCLFIAGKMEEIYPPQINEYSYVSDGACEDKQIVAKELAILTALKWDICPMTPNNWLTLFLQLSQLPAERNDRLTSSDSDVLTNDLLKSNISAKDFSICAQLLDLCTLCMDSICYSPLHLAASVISHMLGPDKMEKVSGLDQDAIKQCYQWMQPFVLTIREQSPQRLAASADLNKQVHNVNLALLERAHKLSKTQEEQSVLRSSKSNNNSETPTRTPTASRKRSFHDDMTPPSTSKQMRLNDENTR